MGMLIFLIVLPKLHSQNIYTQKLLSGEKLNLPDSLWMDSSSLQLFLPSENRYLKLTEYQIIDGKLILSQLSKADTVLLSVRYLPIIINRPIFIHDSSKHQYGAIPDYVLEDLFPTPKEDWWDQKGISYTGNYLRGISVGSSQSLIVNSALNLQLNGELGDGINIVGAISDNQIPIQPEGNTRQIQEFDKLYLRLSKNKTALTAGDFEIGKPTGYFSNYYKKSQGGMIDHVHSFKKWGISHKGSFAISRGKFQRMNIDIVNGNQGPYRLRGRDGEGFIILLAGTEKVFLDGIQLVRGDDADYVMDYNLGEIRFTPRRLVTDQMRIIIEFEYSDQNYLRSLSTYNFTAVNGPWTTWMNIYRESDSKRPALASDQDSLDRRILSASGDNQALAVRSSIARSGSNFNENRIYYLLKDTLISIKGVVQRFEILVFNPMPDSNSLQASFSDVGIKNGTYQLSLSNANGRIYIWVGYDQITGEPLGNYEPNSKIIAPRSQFLNTVGLRFQSTNIEKAGFVTEIAQSSLDLNRLSNIDDQNNLGFSTRSEIWSPLLKYKSNHLRISGFHEFKDNAFVALNAYRNQEFNRDWNIENQFGQTEQYYGSKIQMSMLKRINLAYQFTGYKRSPDFNGFKNEVLLGYQDSLNDLTVQYNILQTDHSFEKTNFLRPNFRYQRKWSTKLISHIYASREKNERRSSSSDSLLSSSFHFDVFGTGIQYQLPSGKFVRMEIKRRNDYFNQNNAFSLFSISDDLTFLSQWSHTKWGVFDLSMTGRKIQYSDEKIQDSIGQYNLLGQIDHFLSIQKNAIRIKNIYSIQSGAEPRLEFIYEERRPGDGDYIYQDFNADGIRQIQEYIYAPDVDTARYIRLQVFNSEYIQSFQSNLNQAVSVDFNKLLAFTKEKNFLRKLSFESVLRFQSKLNPTTEWYEQINPFYNKTEGNGLLAFQRYSQQQLFINRANSIYEIQNTYSYLANRQLLTFGTDEKNQSEFIHKSRITSFQQLDWLVQYNYRDEKRAAGNYTLQNYRMITQRAEFSALYRINKNARTSLAYSFKNAREIENQKERAKIHQFQWTGQIYFLKKYSIRTDVKWIQIDFTGARGTAIEFIVLEGFKDGSNLSADLGFDLKISQQLTGQFLYSVRKSAGSEAIHTGRASLRANF